jgi:hypothetical protein
MKKITIYLTVILSTISLLLLPACASNKEAPDPVKMQEEIAEYRSQERELVRSTVLDEGRAERLIDLLADRDRLIADNGEMIDTHRKKLTALNADYNASRESLDAQVNSFNDQRATAQQEFISVVKAMKQETTAEEWKTISKYQIKRLEPRKLTYNRPSGGT